MALATCGDLQKRGDGGRAARGRLDTVRQRDDVWYEIQLGAEKACCGRFVDTDRWLLGSDGPQNDEGSNGRVMVQ